MVGCSFLLASDEAVVEVEVDGRTQLFMDARDCAADASSEWLAWTVGSTGLPLGPTVVQEEDESTESPDGDDRGGSVLLLSVLT